MSKKEILGSWSLRLPGCGIRACNLFIAKNKKNPNRGLLHIYPQGLPSISISLHLLPKEIHNLLAGY